MAKKRALSSSAGYDTDAVVKLNVGGNSMDDRDTPVTADSPDGAAPALASCQAARDAEGAVPAAAEEEPQSLPISAATEADGKLFLGNLAGDYVSVLKL